MFLEDNRKNAQAIHRYESRQRPGTKQKRYPSAKEQNLKQAQNFPLLLDTQQRQLQRKKKETAHYAFLKQQLESEKKRKAELARREKQMQDAMEAKIRRENEQQKQQYQKQRAKQQQKKGIDKDQVDVVNLKTEESSSTVKSTKPMEVIRNQPTSKNANEMPTRDFFNTNNYQRGQIDAKNYHKINKGNSFSRYDQSRNHKSAYYEQLLDSRRLLQQQTNSMAELGKIIQIQRKKNKQQSQTLEELKVIQSMLDDKNSSYMAGFDLKSSAARQQHHKTSTFDMYRGYEREHYRDRQRKLD